MPAGTKTEIGFVSLGLPSVSVCVCGLSKGYPRNGEDSIAVAGVGNSSGISGRMRANGFNFFPYTGNLVIAGAVGGAGCAKQRQGYQKGAT